MAQLKRSTEQATALVDSNPDDEGKLNSAVIRLAQEKIFSILVELDIDPEDIDVAKLFKAAAEVGKASVQQNKAQFDIRERIAQRAAAVATSVAQTAKKAGLSDDTINTIRTEILGIPAAK